MKAEVYKDLKKNFYKISDTDNLKSKDTSEEADSKVIYSIKKYTDT